ncbi:hypothetical protein COU60_00550 [Candidatus Pacearchaeota archaeon CG10_big_fil_rev_8_21_14_0_10_34_76]|nr:MAG: hypothetical protein COU60_00550 [Candidatus Pacearchaeota archaeon CG10_big_fil_rev_8_21_14_0_10_34_76]
MSVTQLEVRRIGAITFILTLVVLAFLVIRPILLSIITGLILAYAFNPLYIKVKKVLREKNTSAFIVGLLVLLIIIIPLWFLIPLLIQQVFDAFTSLKGVDVANFVQRFFPIDSARIQVDITNAIINFIAGITNTSLSALADFLLELPTILLNLAVVIFVFFFALRDQDKLKEFVSGISPLRKDKEKILVKQFKDLTSSIIFGQIIIGIIQGVATGIGLLVAGVPNALLLTLFATGASIIPIIGPWLIWVPAAIYLLSIGNTTAAIIFAIYSAVVVSSIDNFLRPYIVARKTKSSSVVVLIGMIGGLFVFGILGLILGPLILSYVILFIEAYKNKTLSDMFA